jgi:hypothetical protein
VGEGHVDALRVYGPEQTAAIVTLKASAPGGARQCKVRRTSMQCCTACFFDFALIFVDSCVVC